MCLRVSCKQKSMKFFFCILKVTEERSLIRSWIRIHSSEVKDPRIQIRIRTKMAWIPNTDYDHYLWLTLSQKKIISESPSILRSWWDLFDVEELCVHHLAVYFHHGNTAGGRSVRICNSESSYNLRNVELKALRLIYL
jgi:hypothetical protein